MTTASSLHPVVARAREAALVIAPLAGRMEAERRLPAEAVRALVDAGVFKVLVPRALGGSEAPLGVALGAIEEVARADGSAGWCVMIAVTSSLVCFHLDDATAREVFAPADAITCGVFAPLGRATRVEGGYRVSGRWPFASGCEVAGWRSGGAIVEGDPPLPSGAPEVVSMLFRAAETRVIDTWDVSGLRGTGSHDVVAEDVLVPASRAFSLLRGGQAAQVPFFGALAASVAAVALGIARAAIDAFVALARKKQPLGGRRTIAQRELVQLHVAQAEGKVRAARALLYEAVEAAAREAEAGPVPLETRASLRIAACHATTESAAAVDLAYHAAGATGIYAASPLQRCFRDVHVATQHIMVGPVAATLAGRVLLGLDADTTTL